LELPRKIDEKNQKMEQKEAKKIEVKRADLTTNPFTY